MFKFIKDALAELEHVVWPTNSESKKYMGYTVGIIIIVATMLAILGYVIRGSLVAVREQFDHTPLPTMSLSGEETSVDADLERLKAEFSDSVSVSSEVALPEPILIEETSSSDAQ